MASRLVVLIPSVGPPEILPSSVSPAHVLSVGPVISSKLTRHRELFWSMSSYQQHEVNDFASKVVGYTVKGDACVVEECAGEPKGSLDDVLNAWKRKLPIQCKVSTETLKEPRAPKQHISAAKGAPQRNEKSKHMSQSIIKENQINLEREAVLSSDDTCPVSAIATEEVKESLFVNSPGIEGMVVSVAISEDSKQCLSHKQAAGRTYPSKVGEQTPMSRENPPKRVPMGTIINQGLYRSEPVESGTVVWGWDDLQSDVIGQICQLTSSCASIISLSGVCTHWRKCIISDKRLIKDLQFSIDVGNPLRKIWKPYGAMPNMLQRKHTQCFPRILIKAGDLGNVSAYTILASLYEACNMHFEALKYWRSLSHLGDPLGCWKHGEMLYSGRGDVSRDAETAQRLLLKSGKQVQKSDHPRKKEVLRGVGMCLGYLFLDGEVGSPDNQRAVEWFQISAQNGSKEAQRTLGWMFNTGQYG